MGSLANYLTKAVPRVVEEWNNVKLDLFLEIIETSFQDFFTNEKKVLGKGELTKVLSPILNQLLLIKINEMDNNFIKYEKNGCDYKFYDTEIECKIATTLDNAWTGNGYSKTPIHMLLKFEFNLNGTIDSYFSMLTDLSKCKGSWSEKVMTSNYSTLKFLNEDLDKLIICNGEAEKKVKFLGYKFQKHSS